MIDQNDSFILVMHAESIGLIPPNTVLLIIQYGTTHYEIGFEGDAVRERTGDEGRGDDGEHHLVGDVNDQRDAAVGGRRHQIDAA